MQIRDHIYSEIAITNEADLLAEEHYLFPIVIVKIFLPDNETIIK